MTRLDQAAVGEAEDVVVDPVLRQRFRFERTTAVDGAEVLHAHCWVDRGGGVPPHVHPAMEERFHVVEGRPEFLAGRRWSEAVPGETVVVPAGTRHAYRNRNAEAAYVVCEARPPSTLEQFLTDAATLNRSGGITRHALPKTPGALLQAMLLVEHYRPMVEMGFPPLPPSPLQRLIVTPLARLARRRGYTIDPIAPR